MTFFKENFEKRLINESFKQTLFYSSDKKKLKLLIENLGEYKVVWLQAPPEMSTELKNYLIRNKLHLARIYKDMKIISKKPITYNDRLELLAELTENNYEKIEWDRISDYLKKDKIYFSREEFNELKNLLEEFAKNTNTKLILKRELNDFSSIYHQ